MQTTIRSCMLLLLLAFTGCETEKIIFVPTPTDVDLALLGTWYSVDSLTSPYPGPAVAISGFDISTDHQYRHLAIATESGRLTPTGATMNLSKASEGELVLPSLGEVWHYMISNDRLILNFPYGLPPREYRRSYVGACLARPSRTSMSMNTDYMSYSVPSVSDRLPAFASQHSPTELSIRGLFQTAGIEMIISDFHGIGTYPVDSVAAVFFFGDVVDFYHLSSPSDGVITIQEYDTQTLRCSGTFSLTLVEESRPTKAIRRGYFSVPLFL